MIFTTLPGGATNCDYSFNHITVKEGLSQSTVLSIYKDSKGFMWFGTRTGLNRYDGKDFKVFLQDPTDSISLNFGFFLSISEDSLSNLWVGSQAGVYRYDRTLEKFQLFLHQPDDSHSLASNVIRKILIDSKGLIWICHTKGVDLYDQTENRFIHVLQELENGNEIDPEKIYSIEEDAKGRIWISSSHCLYHLMWEERKIIGYDVSQEPELINADAKEMFLFSSSTGKLWAVHQRGLIFYFDEPSDQFLREEAYQSHLSNTVECLGEDFDHNLLIGTSQEGLYVFNDHLKTVTNYTHSAADPNSLSTDHLYSICTDSDGTIWIGTWNSGVNYTHKYLNNFSTIVQDEYRNSLLYNNVKSIFEDNNHHIWFGTSKGLSILDPETGKFDNYLTSTGNDQHSINTVNKCCETDPGIYWIGTSMPGGIFLFNKARKDIRPLQLSWDTDNILDGLAVFSIDKDKHGIIWIGAISGVYAVDCLRQKIRHFSTKNSRLPSDVIRSSFLDSKGLLWFGTSKGFCSYNPEINDFDRYKSLDIYNRSSPEWIFSFCEDKTGDFWIGSAGYGLILLDRNSGEIMRFTTEQGLTSNVVTGILEDKNGYLWISTYNGISKFNPVEKQVEQNYSIHDGMESNCFNENSQLRTSEGLFYFGGIHGVTYFDPSQFTKNPVIPELVITDLLIFNTPVEIGAKGSPLKKSISETSQIKLKHDQNSISFQFVSLNFVNPMKNRYLCFLDGYDEDWYEPLSPGTAHYNNLDPGTYTFRIKGSNNDGLWNESGSVLLIEILPPFWRTQLAYLIYIISFLGLLFFYSRFIRIREEEKRMIHQERLEKEKIKDLNQARLQFFTNIAHDFRLPLSLITGPVEELKNYYSEDPKFTNLVQLVSHNAKRLLTLANEILTFRKMGTGQLELHLQQGDFILFLHHIIEEFRPLVDRRGIALTFHSFETHFGFCFDKEKMERVLYNLLDNACKHTPENGEICIKVTSADPDHQTIEVSIFNTGKCIPKKDSTKIFDSFYQINDERDVHNRGYGIGLTLVRGIIELHKGNIKLRIVENRGNEFIFTLPAIKGMEVEEVSSVTLEEMIQNPDQLLNDGSDFEVFDNQPVAETCETEEKPVILLIEDNEELLSYISARLQKRFKVYEARNGMEGESKALRYTPDLIISDVMMPEMDGIELCTRIKNDVRICHIPVILLTARAEMEYRIEGLEVGCDAYLTKPFVCKHLEKQILNLIENRRILARKYSYSDNPDTSAFTTNKLDQDFLERATTFIKNNISEPGLNIDNLSKKLNISRRHLHRKIKSLTDHAPIDFIIHLRLKKSMELIHEGKYTISEIGYHVGFNNPSYFTQSFKKMYGQPPSFFLQTKA